MAVKRVIASNSSVGEDVSVEISHGTLKIKFHDDRGDYSFDDHAAVRLNTDEAVALATFIQENTETGTRFTVKD